MGLWREGGGGEYNQGEFFRAISFGHPLYISLMLFVDEGRALLHRRFCHQIIRIRIRRMSIV